MKKIVPRLTEGIRPSPSNPSISNIQTRFTHEVLCAFRALFCWFRGQHVTFLRFTNAVETHTA